MSIALYGLKKYTTFLAKGFFLLWVVFQLIGSCLQNVILFFAILNVYSWFTSKGMVFGKDVEGCQLDIFTPPDIWSHLSVVYVQLYNMSIGQLDESEIVLKCVWGILSVVNLNNWEWRGGFGFKISMELAFECNFQERSKGILHYLVFVIVMPYCCGQLIFQEMNLNKGMNQHS